MNFIELLEQYNIPYETEGRHSRQGWVQIDCPYCGQDSEKFHMGYSLDGRFLNCWQCGPHDLVKTLCELTGLSVFNVKKLVEDLPITTTEIVKIKGQLKLPVGIGPLQRPHIKYLKSRGYNPDELIRLWHIEGIGISPTHSWRIFIPIHLRDQLVSWTTRAVSENTSQRYLGAPAEQEALNKTDLLYGEQYVRHAIIICEGPFDAWKIGPGAVATLGLNFTPSQIERMLKYPIRIVCLDNQPTAQQRAQGLADMLSLYPGDTYNIQLDSKDAGSATEKEINKLRRLLK